MPLLRVALAQVDLTVGDLAGNAETALRAARDSAAAGASVLVLPEMTLTGYPPEDLVLRRSFVLASERALEGLATRLAAEGLGDLAVVCGFLGLDEGGLRNAAAWLQDGRVVARYAKHHLPNYGVFDEARYFRPGTTLPVVRLSGVDVAMTVCEDLWVDGGPVATARAAQVGLVLCLNGSPYERGKSDARLAFVQRRAVEAGAPLAYVNTVGGQDELVFDGDSVVVAADGTVLARGPQFAEALLVLDVDCAPAPVEPPLAVDAPLLVERVTAPAAATHPGDRVEGTVAPRLAYEEEVYAALVTGTRDYVRKNRFRSVVLGLSGGIDSALVATIAADALGADAVHVVGLPSRWSSDHSLADAEELARRQGLHWSVVPIAPMVDAYEGAVELTGLAAENLQARVRGTTLMALSNQSGHLVLTTGNKSELATGYSTLYGDSAGGFAPIKDVPKTLVWALARWRNASAAGRGEGPPIPENSITKPPSAELRPGQLDSDSLPPYDVLDDLLDDYVEQDKGREDLVAAGFDPDLVDRVVRLVDLAEYKRRQYPPGPKTTLKAFGRDRRLPITNRWRESP